MRKHLVCLFVGFLVIVQGRLLLSQTVITFGGHYWYAESDYKGDRFENIDISPGNMFGPYLNVRLGRFILGSSLFFGTFEWEDRSYSVTMDINRSDLNFSLGYAFAPRFNVFAAVKRISLTGEMSGAFPDTDERVGRLEKEYKGLLYGAGVSGFLPFRRSRLFLFWSAAYLMGTIDGREESIIEELEPVRWDGEFETDITALTVGVGYQIPSGLALMVGYRADLSGENNEETIHGIMATLAYTVR
jgi:hypothetical protein